MTKVLLLLSALVMGIAAVFAFQNGRTFKDVRESKDAVHSKIKTELTALAGSVEDINKVIGEVAKVQSDVEGQMEKLKSNKLKIAQTEGETKRTVDELKSKTDKMNQLSEQLKKLPAGFNPQTISEDLNKIKQEIAELQTQAEAKKQEVTVQEKKIGESQKVLADIVEKIETRKKSFERNSMKARVVAVNNDWGFVVIDVGEKEGITPDTKLLVTRGTQTVGKINTLSVQGNRTVANVLTDTLAIGMIPAPGDTVILENLFQ
jgi:peptidoglycan hydrolase CwlO-like protein